MLNPAKQRSLLSRGMAVVTVFAVLSVQCAAGRHRIEVEVAYRHAAFVPEMLAGKSLLVLPPLSREGFIETGPLSPDSLIASLSRPELTFVVGRPFEKAFIGSFGRATYDTLLAHWFRKEVVDLQTADSLWQLISADFLLFTRLCHAVRVKGFNRTIKRRVVLEEELWSKKDQSVLWRTEVRGVDIDPQKPDSRFLAEMIVRGIESLPPVPAHLSEEDEW